MDGTEPRKPYRIMIVDDEDLDRRFCKRTLLRAPFECDVIECSGGSEALGYLADPGHRPVDLILLDVNMPGMGGIDFISRFAATVQATAPPIGIVVMLTAPLPPHRRAQFDSFSEVCAFLDKPLRIDALSPILAALPAGATRI